ncbi:PAS domain-containing sensor histidine kinase [Rhodohalobacter sp.]|uniref:PAS domain-containing sensor histidine kinase n=1 Tax=Rhodohalobacter sp. TaxID=1974210 RepID=UPI002ACDF796|nr:PAS domain-containing sensor histidine kinase [Rhodohalobacter sp.]MDZ7755632.1 PAS domain-containing sensor histidine kinase [Rhodohalobacter sp.]
MIEQHDLLDRALATAKLGVWTYDQNLSIFQLSENAREIFEVETNRLTDISELLHRFASDHDRKKYKSCLEKIIETGEPQSGIFQIVCKNNNTKWVRCIGQPEQNYSITKSVFGTVQDITDHIETERKLAETQQKYELMAKNSSDGIIIIDREVTTFASPGFLRLMRYDTFEDYLKATQGSLRPVIHPDDKPGIKTKFKQKISEQADTGTYQFRALTGDGTYIWREDHVNYQYDSKGHLEKTYAVCRDVTKRKQTEKKLRKLIEDKNWLVSTIVHDIRNPISAGVSLNSVLLEEIEDEEQIKLIRAANERLESALSLAAELLELSSMEDENFVLEKEPTHPSQYLSGIIESFQTTAEENGVELIFDEKLNTEQILLNQEKIQRALSNLISNALKFTPKDGRVTLSAILHEDFMQIEISDTGIGIPAEHLPTLFEKFTEAKREGLHGETTTGLGLSITKQIIELHGGSITVSSAEGEGTTFTIKLPLS